MIALSKCINLLKPKLGYKWFSGFRGILLILMIWIYANMMVIPIYLEHITVTPMHRTIQRNLPKYRARPDWAYEFPDRTGPDTQICRTGPAGPDWIQTYISNIFPNKYGLLILI